MAAKKSEAPTPQITGGRVVFSRSVQPAQYESKKAEVEITFAVPEGAEIGDFLNKAADMAQGKALEMVGLQKGQKVAQAAPETSQEAKKEPAAGSKAALEKAQAEKLADAPSKKAVVMPAISTGEERTDPAQEPAAEISDAAMKDACSKRNQAIKAPQAIKALIATFVPFPKGCADISQDKRQDFLTQLAALTADGPKKPAAEDF